MSQVEAVSSTVMSPIIYRNVPCISTEMLAKAYEVEANSIKKNFSTNKERFTEGKHYFLLQGKDFTEFCNLQVTKSNLQISSKARHFTLWTERGAARHAKMLNSDKAWDMFELLEENFFKTAEKKTASTVSDSDAPITQDQQYILQQIVRTRLGITGKETGKNPGGFFPCVWSRFNNHFSLDKYSQLPQSKMNEAVKFLLDMDIEKAKGKTTENNAQLVLVEKPAKTKEKNMPMLMKAAPTVEQIKEINLEYWKALDDFRKALSSINAKCDWQITMLARSSSDSVFQDGKQNAIDSFLDVMLAPFFDLKYRRLDALGKLFDNIYKNMLVMRAMLPTF